MLTCPSSLAVPLKPNRSFVEKRKPSQHWVVSTVIVLALARWRDRQNLSTEDKQSLLYYVQEPEGLGILKAYTSPEQEQQFQTWLIEKF